MLPGALSNKNLFWAAAALAAALLFSSCAPYQARRTSLNYRAAGTASWYGPGFHGRKTSSGERYNQRALTAAHRSLPFGSAIRVTSVDNGKSVVVRINDRGPFVKGRIIDLSRAAAQKIGMVGSGTAEVKLASLGADSRPTDLPPAESEPSPGKKSKSRKSRFSPPPSLPEEPRPKPKPIIVSPSDDNSTEGLYDIREDVKGKTGMPDAEDTSF